MNTTSKMIIAAGLLCLVLIAAPACRVGAAPETPPLPGADSEGSDAPFTLVSDDFAQGADIPVKFTCDGFNYSPPLAWTGAPAETAAYALVVDDPDAPGGTFIHWVLINIPGDTFELAESVSDTGQLPGNALEMQNGTGEAGYIGPCPPPGPAHRYRFTIYALDEPLDLTEPAPLSEVEAAMEGHVLDMFLLTGMYQRAD